MIGRLLKDKRAVATLGDNGAWRADDHGTQNLLNAMFPPSDSPSSGEYGRRAVVYAAERLNLEFEFGPELKAVEGDVVY